MYTVKLYEKEYTRYEDYAELYEYIYNRQKSRGRFGAYGAFAICSEDVAKSMALIYDKRNDSEDKNRLFHVIIRFEDEDNHEETADRIFRYAQGTAEIIGENHQVVFGVHWLNDDGYVLLEHPEIHLMINSVKWSTLDVVENTTENRRKLIEQIKDAVPRAIQKYDDGGFDEKETGEC